jgi:hypothetical protein
MRLPAYVIFSVDTEHDIISRYETKTAGWSEGIPLLCQVFDAAGIRGKVCWLIEYNLKDGIPAANPRSPFFVKEFPELIGQIKNRQDELGLHPTMYDWLGGDRHVPASSYNDAELWDNARSYHDPEFVVNLITSGVKEFRKACGVSPIGCRTGGFHYATHLATALEKNGIYIDSSVSKGLKRWLLTAPNAYYAAGDDIRNKAVTKAKVVEIPTTGYIRDSRSNFLLKLRSWYLLHWRRPIFLSFYIHNWQAIASDGRPDRRFLDILFSTLRFLEGNGASFLSWTEVSEVIKAFESGEG